MVHYRTTSASVAVISLVAKLCKKEGAQDIYRQIKNNSIKKIHKLI
jgi:hypothetical protein